VRGRDGEQVGTLSSVMRVTATAQPVAPVIL